jgi:hypothetical protein
MRFSILLLGTVLSLVCAQAPTPPTILPRQETSTSPSTTIYGTPGVPGVPGTVRLFDSLLPLSTADSEIHSPVPLELLDTTALLPLQLEHLSLRIRR